MPASTRGLGSRRSEDRETEGGFDDQLVAPQGLPRPTGGIATELQVARDHRDPSPVLDADLCGPENVPRRMEGHSRVSEAVGLSPVGRVQYRARPEPATEDRGTGPRDQSASGTRSRVVGVGMRQDGPRDGTPGVDPEPARLAPQAVLRRNQDPCPFVHVWGNLHHVRRPSSRPPSRRLAPRCCLVLGLLGLGCAAGRGTATIPVLEPLPDARWTVTRIEAVVSGPRSGLRLEADGTELRGRILASSPRELLIQLVDARIPLDLPVPEGPVGRIRDIVVQPPSSLRITPLGGAEGFLEPDGAALRLVMRGGDDEAERSAGLLPGGRSALGPMLSDPAKQPAGVSSAVGSTTIEPALAEPPREPGRTREVADSPRRTDETVPLFAGSVAEEELAAEEIDLAEVSPPREETSASAVAPSEELPTESEVPVALFDPTPTQTSGSAPPPPAAALPIAEAPADSVPLFSPDGGDAPPTEELRSTTGSPGHGAVDEVLASDLPPAVNRDLPPEVPEQEEKTGASGADDGTAGLSTAAATTISDADPRSDGLTVEDDAPDAVSAVAPDVVQDPAVGSLSEVSSEEVAPTASVETAVAPPSASPAPAPTTAPGEASDPVPPVSHDPDDPVLGPPAEGPPARRLLSIEPGPAPLVRVRGDGELTWRLFHLEGPSRIVIDLPDVDAGAAAREILLGGALVERVRVGQFRPDVARIVLDLAAPARLRVRREGRDLVLAPIPEPAGP